MAIKRLDNLFMPTRHSALERHVFWSLQPTEGEDFVKFVTRVRQHSEKCSFGTSETESRSIAIMDKLITCATKPLQRKLLEKEMTLSEAIKTINVHQQLEKTAEKMGNSTMPKAEVRRITERRRAATRRNGERAQKSDIEECYRCGRKGHRGSDRNCPAINKTCDKCQIKGHFAIKCRSRKREYTEETEKFTNKFRTQTQENFKRPKIHAIDASRSISDEDTEPGPMAIYNLSADDSEDDKIVCQIGGILVNMLIDSGSTHNIIDECTWRYIEDAGITSTAERTTTTKTFMAYATQTPLKVMKVFDAEIGIAGIKTTPVIATFYVIGKGERPLLWGKRPLKSWAC